MGREAPSSLGRGYTVWRYEAWSQDLSVTFADRATLQRGGAHGQPITIARVFLAAFREARGVHPL